MPMKNRSHTHAVDIEKNVAQLSVPQKKVRRKSAVGPKGSSPFPYHEFTTKEMEVAATASDYDPLEYRSVEHPTTNMNVIIHLLKGTIGPGILAMPDAFRNAGLVAGTVGMALNAIIAVYSMHILVDCSRELCRRIRVPTLTFAEVARLSFQVGPKPLKKFANSARIIVNVFLCLTQLGICCVYFVFVPASIENMDKVAEVGGAQHFNPPSPGGYTPHPPETYRVRYNGSKVCIAIRNKSLANLVRIQFVKSQWGYEGLSTLEYMSMLVLPMICLNMIRNLKLLAPFMMVANIALALGLGIIMYYVVQDLPPLSSRIAVASISQLPLYFGTAMYAFISIAMILPVENSMKNPKDLLGWNGVLNTSMIIVACCLTTLGFYGYLKYGDDIQASITLNLPSGDLLALSVQLLMALSVFLSYALQFYVPVNIMWPAIKGNIYSEKMQLLLEYGFRLCVVVFTFVLAAAVPDLSLFISLVGAFCSTTLGLIFPPVISMLTNYSKGYGLYKWKLVKDAGILFVGVFGMLAGTYVSLQQVIVKL